MATSSADCAAMRNALTIKGIADLLNCCEQTARRLIQRGELRGFRVGSEYRVFPADLDAYVQSQMESA